MMVGQSVTWAAKALSAKVVCMKQPKEQKPIFPRLQIQQPITILGGMCGLMVNGCGQNDENWLIQKFCHRSTRGKITSGHLLLSIDGGPQSDANCRALHCKLMCRLLLSTVHSRCRCCTAALSSFCWTVLLSCKYCCTAELLYCTVMKLRLRSTAPVPPILCLPRLKDKLRCAARRSFGLNVFVGSFGTAVDGRCAAMFPAQRRSAVSAETFTARLVDLAEQVSQRRQNLISPSAE